MGRYSYAIPKVHTYGGDGERVIIGCFTSIAAGVAFLPGGNHHTSLITTSPIKSLMGFFDTDRPRPNKGDVVGNDVWIGRGAQILGGVTIGHGAVVAAYSVVARNVEPYTLVAGNPGVPKRRRFSEDQCEALLKIAWWDWPDHVIAARVDELYSGNVSEFTARYL